MNCENIFCIYQKKDQCTLETIHLNIMGICEDCIYFEMPEVTLQEYKKATLRRFYIKLADLFEADKTNAYKKPIDPD